MPSRLVAPYEEQLVRWEGSWIAAGLLNRLDVAASTMNPLDQDALSGILASALRGLTIRTAADLPLDLRRQLGV